MLISQRLLCSRASVINPFENIFNVIGKSDAICGVSKVNFQFCLFFLSQALLSYLCSEWLISNILLICIKAVLHHFCN